MTRLEHVGVVVSDLESAKAFYRDTLACQLVREADLPDRGVRIAFFACGPALIELVEYEDREESLSRLGSDNVQARLEHLAFAVDDLQAISSKLRALGIRSTTPEPTHIPQLGSHSLFTDPASSGGVIYQFLMRDRELTDEP